MPNAKIYVLKAINRTGTGKLSWVINAIKYAIEKRVDIMVDSGVVEEAEYVYKNKDIFIII